jgi:hypothetical protein
MSSSLATSVHGTGQISLEALEPIQFAGPVEFVAQVAHYAVEHGSRPFAQEDALGSLVVAGLAQIVGFAGLEIERQRGRPSAALQSSLAVVGIGQKVLDGAQQEGAEPAFFRIGPREESSGQDAQEKLLGQILRLFRHVSAAANEGVDGIPVALAEALQRGAALRRGQVAAGGHYQRPTGGRKRAVAFRRRRAFSGWRLCVRRFTHAGVFQHPGWLQVCLRVYLRTTVRFRQACPTPPVCNGQRRGVPPQAARLADDPRSALGTRVPSEED